jgi:hypothetical protein
VGIVAKAIPHKVSKLMRYGMWVKEMHVILCVSGVSEK